MGARWLSPNGSLEPVAYDMFLGDLFPEDTEEELRLNGGEYFSDYNRNKKKLPIEEMPSSGGKIYASRAKSARPMQSPIAPDPFTNAKGKKIIRRPGNVAMI